MKKYKFLKIPAVITAAVITLTFAGCKKASSANTDDTSIDRTLNIGIVGDACELHFYAAEMLGLFEKAGYKVNWIQTMEQQAQIVAGKIDVTDGVLDSWLKAIEQGLDVKITTGLQQGCMGTIVLADSPYNTLSDLKGQKVGSMSPLGGGASAYMWRLMVNQGIDPLNDYEWFPFEMSAALLALEKGEVSAVGLPDTVTWPLVKDGTARYVSRMGSDPELADQTCCVLVFNSDFTGKYPGVTKKLTEILTEAAEYTETHKEEVIQYGYDSGLIIMGTAEDSVELTKAYKWTSGYKIAEDTFRSIFADYQRVNIIDKDIDVNKVVDRVFIKYDN